MACARPKRAKMDGEAGLSQTRTVFFKQTKKERACSLTRTGCRLIQRVVGVEGRHHGCGCCRFFFKANKEGTSLFTHKEWVSFDTKSRGEILWVRMLQIFFKTNEKGTRLFTNKDWVQFDKKSSEQTSWVRMLQKKKKRSVKNLWRFITHSFWQLSCQKIQVKVIERQKRYRKAA